jgi:Prealbumin-like fold domain
MKRRSSLVTMFVSAVVALCVLGVAALPASAAFQFQNDEQGANDQPGQKDLTRHGVDSTGLPTSVDVTWNWDITSLSGGNTGDACSLFDTDSDARVNFAVCVTIEGDPAQQSSLSPRLYTCGDDKVDRCTQPVGQITSFSTTCSASETATDPFPSGSNSPFDMTALCTVQLADVGGTVAKLINTCSYPSEAPNSDPSDCVLIPRDGFLKIVKNATPDDPSAQFNFFLDGDPTAIFTTNGSGTSSTIGVRTDNNPHSLSETFPSGWQQDSATCDDGSAVGALNVSSDETVTCTFDNSLALGTLIVKKHVVSDNGGALTASDFNLHVKKSGSDVTDSPASGSESGTSYSLNSGSYDVSEDATPSGYTRTGFTGDCDSSGNVTVVAGQTKTCTITNDDVAPTLHLRKLITNDNGGGAAITDWTLNANGTGSNDLSGSTPVDSGATLKADTFTLSESDGPSGYSPSDWDCSGGTQGTGADKDKIAVALGEEATCTITNDDVAPTLTVIKHVTNDNGGSATADQFSMHVKQSGSDVSGKSPFAGDESGTQRTLDAGSYNVSETGGPSGYSASTSGDCSSSGDVSLAVGEHKTCTITNDDVAPKLTVVKHVINDNGGGATAGQFSMHIELGGSDVSGKSPFAGSEAGTQRTLDAGSYNVSETGGPSGYSASTSGDCSSSGDVSLAVGQTKTCTITNDDVAPTLTVIKHVVNDNGGSSTAGQFSMHVRHSGSDVSGKSPFAGDESGTSRTLSAGSFNVSETGGPSGYASSVSGDCATNGDVTLALAQNKTCTITNNDIAPKLTVIKHVVNDNSGSATAGLFSMHVKLGGSDVSGKSPFAGAESGVQRTLDAGSYVVSESDGPTGYAASISGACASNGAVTLAPGDVKSCTITNNDFAITTSLTDTSGVTGPKITLAQGATVSDVATLVGAPANAGGTVTYKVFTNSACTTLLQTAGTGNVGAANVAAASDQVTFNQLGTYYWMAYYSGSGSLDTQKSKCGDEIVTVVTPSAPLTPGYWKTHKAETTKLLPITLGNYGVDTFAKATAVFDNMNCSTSSDNGAIGCLAGHLLATKLNLKNLSSPCIVPVVAKSDAFLKGQSVTYAGITANGINYTGPASSYTLTSAQRNLAIALKSAMDKYNNGGGC